MTFFSHRLLLPAAIALLVAPFVTAPSGAAQTSGARSSQRMNARWEYLEESDSSIARVSRMTGWRSIEIPHSWNAFDAVDPVPGYRRGASWYRRQLDLPTKIGPRRVLISFEGVNMSCRVFVNGVEAGRHIGGYLGFDIDVTPLVRSSGAHWLYVWVDNSYNPDVVPSQKSDFFIYGGITRDVWMTLVPAGYVERVHIRTMKVSEKSADAEVRVQTRNTSTTAMQSVVAVSIADPRGRVIAVRDTTVLLPPGTHHFSLQMPSLQNPELWSPDHPALYSATVKLASRALGEDVVQEKFGCRWYEFVERGPFMLNGKRLLLRGTHRHEDYAGLANAIPDSLHRKDVQMMKEMGANFVRLAHYPQDPEVYRACDELGILVWDELPWCRGGVGGDAWKANVTRLLREQIVQNYNHPSIILWSLGNEINYDFDFDGGDNIDSLRAFMFELRSIARILDPDRLTSVRKFYEAADLVDVFSPSIWMGWYSGQYDNYEKAITDARGQYPRLIHMEYGGDSHVGRHVENPLGGDGYTTPDGWEKKFERSRLSRIAIQSDWSESYIVDLMDWHLHVSERLDWFVGNAQWAFKDFATPLRPENPIPYVNQKGLVDRAGVPKDAYYVYKSYWTRSPEFCYIVSHTWTERNGPKGLKRSVRVYSNCDEVELQMNGASLGKRRRNITDFPACGLRWDVEFVEGSNALRALGFHEGRGVAQDTLRVTYRYAQPGEAAELHLTATRATGSSYIVHAVALDKQGNPASGYNKRIYFHAEGSGRLIADRGTATGSRIIEMANGRAQIAFEAVPGKRAVIEARTQELKGSFVTIPNVGDE